MSRPTEADQTVDDRQPPASPQPARNEITVAVGKKPRAARACDHCRRLKERCTGGTPCDGCIKSKRQCAFTNAYRRSRRRPEIQKLAETINPRVFFDIDRIRNLEAIVQHFTNIQDFSPTQLAETVAALSTDKGSSPASRDLANLQRDETSDDTPSNQGTKDATSILAYEEFSHSDFTRQIQQKLGPDLERPSTDPTASVATAEQLLSFPFVVQDAVSLFPPAEVATTLLDIFFNVAQTNYFYVDEEHIRNRISDIYTHVAAPLTIADAPWVCTALMVFCVSTQFAHLVKGRQSNTGEVDVTSAIDDALALSFYRKATAMIPDLLTIGSAQCVQAFILMGVYTLPVDPAGLASSYYGIAMKIAIHNNMHLKSKSKTRDTEMRNRIWWTVYTLERRVSILHGRPASIQRSQISTELPVNSLELQPSGRPNTFHNAMAQKDLTEIMEDARDNILMIKRATPSSSIIVANDALKVNQALETWWDSLPEETYCKDLTPGQSLFRSNIHLALTYHLVHIFIGRSFMFDDSDADKLGLHGWVNARNTLIKRCIQSAITSIRLCQKLHDEFGLSKSSYTEFTSCCAAVVTLIAQRILSKTVEFGDICDQGITLLKIMSGGVFANTKSSEKRGLEILEMALAKLGASHGESPSLGGAGYDQFRNWVALQVEPEQMLGQEQAMPTMEWAYGSSPGQGSFRSEEMNLMPEFVPTNFAELASLPGLENYFQSSIG
ncbi:fungal-specific transcription factor domain-containing protein [Fusarium solani]|uniref:Fungal-specific transcription factor domain-containing protein n=1 Tax=Fusarium solani TaxID=169388 RepID=A0A9P9GFZ1_FUSSL|nr:fungal-specific transcription factor domain-containing protein [Fusarium solani]KAH7237279.1 fungal-specific transcription factor domain-containing protein [Fusarium solani]